MTDLDAPQPPSAASAIAASLLLVMMLLAAIQGDHTKDNAWENMVKYVSAWTGLGD